MGILNYTSTVSPAKSAAQVTQILSRYQVVSIQTLFTAGEPSGLAFAIETPHGTREFRLPVDVDGVLRAMQRDRSVSPRYRTREQATRTAWRILKDWIEAQLALIEAGMTRMDEVMLPYMLTPTGATVAQLYQEQAGRFPDLARLGDWRRRSGPLAGGHGKSRGGSAFRRRPAVSAGSFPIAPAGTVNFELERREIA